MAEELVLAKGEAMRIVEKNERGNVTYRRRYKKGDVIDTDHIDEARVQALVNDGVLVPKDEYDAGDSDAADYHEGSGDPTGDAAVGAAGVGTQAATGDAGSGEVPVDEIDEAGGDGEDYSDLDYNALKAEIDRRNEGREDEDKLSKSGSADDLRDRLVADDAPEGDTE
jgi:hypothetical protein